jgi:hypothetical protein
MIFMAPYYLSITQINLTTHSQFPDLDSGALQYR